MDMIAKKYFLVSNPRSGSKRNRRRLIRWKSACISAGLVMDYQEISTISTLQEFMDALPDEGEINLIIAGGDGTLNVWINQIMTNYSDLISRICLTIYPCGTGNDWATEKGIQAKPAIWFQSMSSASVQSIPVGRIGFEENGEQKFAYFLNVAGGGLDGLVINRLQNRRQAGKLSYLYEAFLALMSDPYWNLHIEMNGQTQKLESAMVLAGLSPTFGGGLKLTPHTKDGKLALSIFGKLKISYIFRYLLCLFNGKAERIPQVDLCHGNELLVRADPGVLPFYIEADGELICQDFARFSIAEQRLNFLLPRRTP